MSQYLLIRSDDDDPGLTWLDRDALDELLANPDGYGVLTFVTEMLTDDVSYWTHGTAMLLKVELIAPVPAVTAWRLP